MPRSEGPSSYGALIPITLLDAIAMAEPITTSTTSSRQHNPAQGRKVFKGLVRSGVTLEKIVGAKFETFAIRSLRTLPNDGWSTGRPPTAVQEARN